MLAMQPILAPPELESASPTTPTRISFDEYLRQYDSIEGARTEWNAGLVEVYNVSNNLAHNEHIRFLSTLLDMWLGLTALGRLVLAGVPMFVGEDVPAREPDLMVLLNAHLDRLTPRYVNGAADVAVEIVSPESDERDRGKKFLEYEAAGVPEVRGVWSHAAGGSRLWLTVSIKQMYAGHAKQAGLIASQCHAGAYVNRFVVVVDEDINPADIDKVIWAMCTRTEPKESIQFIDGSWDSPADPRLSPEKRAAGDMTHSVAVIDATRPFRWRDQFPPANTPSAEVLRKAHEKFGWLMADANK